MELVYHFGIDYLRCFINPKRHQSVQQQYVNWIVYSKYYTFTPNLRLVIVKSAYDNVLCFKYLILKHWGCLLLSLKNTKRSGKWHEHTLFVDLRQPYIIPPYCQSDVENTYKRMYWVFASLMVKGWGRWAMGSLQRNAAPENLNLFTSAKVAPPNNFSQAPLISYWLVVWFLMKWPSWETSTPAMLNSPNYGWVLSQSEERRGGERIGEDRRGKYITIAHTFFQKFKHGTPEKESLCVWYPSGSPVCMSLVPVNLHFIDGPSHTRS